MSACKRLIYSYFTNYSSDRTFVIKKMSLNLNNISDFQKLCCLDNTKQFRDNLIQSVLLCDEDELHNFTFFTDVKLLHHLKTQKSVFLSMSSATSVAF